MMTRVEMQCPKCGEWTELVNDAACLIIAWGGSWISHCEPCGTVWKIRLTFKEVECGEE